MADDTIQDVASPDGVSIHSGKSSGYENTAFQTEADNSDLAVEPANSESYPGDYSTATTATVQDDHDGYNGHDGHDDLQGTVLPLGIPMANGNAVSGEDKDIEASTEDSQAHVSNLKEERRNRSPLFYCRLITKWPKIAFGVTTIAHLAMVLVTAVLFKIGYDILPITFDRLPLDIRDDPDFLRGLAFMNRNEHPQIILRGSKEEALQDERTIPGEYVQFFFESPGVNVFTKRKLKLMQEVENDFYNNEVFQKKFCYKNVFNDECLKGTSILRYFDGTYSHISPVFNDTNFNNITGVLYEAFINNKTSAGLQYHMGNGAVITPEKVTCKVIRSHLLLGLPLKGFHNSTHNEDEQTTQIEEFMLNEFTAMGEKYFSSKLGKGGKLNFFYFSRSLLMVSIAKLVILDLSLVGGSLLFIVIFMCIQTGSFWITGLSIYSIITSFCTANLLYRVVLDFRYFGIFHVLALFIILGIGADNVFIFFDTWKASGYHVYPSIAHRLSDCYRKASSAMFFTSLTTAIAFIVSASSPFLGVSSFGVFAGLLVAVNYLSVIIFFPTVMVTYHLYWEKYKCCCCCQKKDSETQDLSASDLKQKRWKHPVVRFFRGPYYKVVTHKIGRWIILALFAALLAFFIYYATQVEVNEEQIKFLKDDSNFGKVLTMRASAFSVIDSTRLSKVALVWGLKQQDLSKCHKTDPSCVGDTVYDSKFRMNSPKAQQAFVNFCNQLKNLTQEEIDELHIRQDIITREPEVQCFIQDFAQFVKKEGDTHVVDPRTNKPSKLYPKGTELNFPVDLNESQTIMENHPHIYNTTLLDNPKFSRYFEIMSSFWLYNGFRVNADGNIGSQFKMYNPLVGEMKNPPYTRTWTNPASGLQYYYGTRLAYATILVNTSINLATLGYPKGLPIRNAWETFMKDNLKKMPRGLKKGFQTTVPPVGSDVNLWHWLKVQERLVSSAVQGIVIGICCALPILILATHNVLTGVLATFTMMCIVVVIIGIIPLGGWKIGLLESLNLVLVVGLAVDYVVHLAEGYSRSEHVDRLGRLHDTLEEVGISVLSGAVTTLGASFFMLFAQILFFTQFGLFMFCTIGFSILFALGLFINLMGIFGPEGDFGSLKPLYRWCHKTCKKC